MIELLSLFLYILVPDSRRPLEWKRKTSLLRRDVDRIGGQLLEERQNGAPRQLAADDHGSFGHSGITLLRLWRV
jgi:hypothetical protein